MRQPWQTTYVPLRAKMSVTIGNCKGTTVGSYVMTTPTVVTTLVINCYLYTAMIQAQGTMSAVPGSYVTMIAESATIHVAGPQAPTINTMWRTERADCIILLSLTSTFTMVSLTFDRTVITKLVPGWNCALNAHRPDRVWTATAHLDKSSTCNVNHTNCIIHMPHNIS